MSHTYDKNYSFADILDEEKDFPNAVTAALGFANYLNRLLINTPHISNNMLMINQVRSVMFTTNELSEDYAREGHFLECHLSVQEQVSGIIEFYERVLGVSIDFNLAPRTDHAHHALEYHFEYQILGQMGKENTGGHFNVITYKPVKREGEL